MRVCDFADVGCWSVLTSDIIHLAIAETIETTAVAANVAVAVVVAVVFVIGV